MRYGGADVALPANAVRSGSWPCRPANGDRYKLLVGWALPTIFIQWCVIHGDGSAYVGYNLLLRDESNGGDRFAKGCEVHPNEVVSFLNAFVFMTFSIKHQ